MTTSTKAWIFAVSLSLATGAAAQSVDELVDSMVRADNAGLNDIDNYLIKTQVLNVTTAEYFEKESSLTLDNGDTVYVMRQVPVTEISRRQSEPNALSNATPEQLEQAADMIESQGPQMEAAMREEMAGAGLPGGIGTMIMNPPPGKPWLSANPRDMTANYATMLRGAAEGRRQEDAQDPLADKQEALDSMALLKSKSRIVGRETIDGREAILLEAVDINAVQATENGEFTVQTLRLAVDAEKRVPLRMTIDGELRDGGETRPVKIERFDSDYRQVPGCGELYEPFKSVMRLGGMLSPEEQAQLQEAQAQMADMEKQLADMPPAQRDMVMQQMGPQMKMLNDMASGGGIELATSVVELRCNTGLPDPLEMAGTAVGGAFPAAAMTGGSAAITAAPAGGAGGRVALDEAPAAEATANPVSTAREQCVQEKIQAAQATAKKKRGFGRLLSAVSRTAGRLGNNDIGQAVNDLGTANATAEDLDAAARDLGITDDELAECAALE